MSNKFKVNWLDVILKKEFQNCLDLESLQEISLISKSAREKLKPTLFKCIGFSPNVFNFISMNSNSMFIEFFTSKLYSSANSNTFDNSKNYIIEDELRQINFALSGINTYTKSLHLYKVDKPGYYLFPVISNFVNLTTLSIEECYFKFSVYSKLGELLPNLVQVEFNDVIFAKLANDRTSRNNIIFPPGIKRLIFDECNMSTTKLTSDTCDFLLGDSFDYSTMSDFILPKVSIPSLIELIFYVYGNQSYNGIDAFLEVNPNLESLCIDCFTSGLLKSLTSLNSLELRGEISLNSNINLISLENLKFLAININANNSYETIKKMCLLCPNIEWLCFYLNSYSDFDDIEDIQNIENYHQFIEFFIVPIVSNLYSLKALRIVFSYLNDDIQESFPYEDLLNIIASDYLLEIRSDDDSYETISDSDSLEGINYEEIDETSSGAESLENIAEPRNQELTNSQETLDFTKFSQIEKLYLEIDSDEIYSISFEKYEYLNYLELTSITENINIEMFKEKFNSYSDWNFKFWERKIKGYKQASQL
ncbi:hypothetical protein CONCODRAFT_72981 [Conidiobolus coronatus NRRL 28638]|uniref:Uncharacterized protein n=1 Tax=Conidiobolus coronatus (strain ATCC 28846 / CBS 209.66 / NRRL 28638) TaxID=796925 RepID=A0A137NXK4_CONC2|nr:hypothetical protein CONCODRAFT_72981 [Conidiobolus coronatus NRRL 28638]|eukprot:KXN67404.1 hypothetical protein CONCODRAFT_72981 [Conidiobolus coronatus NRRL 28638]